MKAIKLFKRRIKYHICIVLCVSTLCISAAWAETNLDRTKDTRVSELLKLLKTPVAEYEPTRVADVVDPKLKRKEYVVSWVNAPLYKGSLIEKKDYKHPVKIELTVIASTGYIGSSKIIASSGSKSFDLKVQKSLLVARLEPIPMVDKNLSYTVEHEFSMTPPQ